VFLRDLLHPLNLFLLHQLGQPDLLHRSHLLYLEFLLHPLHPLNLFLLHQLALLRHWLL
jgi:hypothetical protein